MLFNSLTFLAFIAIFLLFWPLFRKQLHARWTFLTLASFVFYGFWDWRFISLLVFSGLVDYTAALGIAAQHKSHNARRGLLILSLIANLGSLAVFKYLNFGIDGLNSAISLTGITGQIPHADLVLPVGISFYTFQSMSYTIDVYMGRISPCRNVLHFFSYLSMFPQLVAGPIERASHLLPQLAGEIHVSRRDRWEGLKLIAAGYFKKVVIADSVAAGVSAAYAGTESGLSGSLASSCPFWWVVAALFAVQIYCDFSGYTDIARGLARWMGFRFGRNFNHPYTALGFSDFWSRWHISLSTWFRDYVYIPLGGSRGSSPSVHGNLWITMLVSGLWHGAATTFIAWGAVHALLLSIERATRWPQWASSTTYGRFAGTIVTFGITLLTWVMFRAESVSQAGEILSHMLAFSAHTSFNIPPLAPTINTTMLMWAAALMSREAWVWGARELLRHPFTRQHFSLRHVRIWSAALEPIFVGLLLAGSVFFRGGTQEFIYFQF